MVGTTGFLGRRLRFSSPGVRADGECWVQPPSSTLLSPVHRLMMAEDGDIASDPPT